MLRRVGSQERDYSSSLLIRDQLNDGRGLKK